MPLALFVVLSLSACGGSSGIAPGITIPEEAPTASEEVPDSTEFQITTPDPEDATRQVETPSGSDAGDSDNGITADVLKAAIDRGIIYYYEGNRKDENYQHYGIWFDYYSTYDEDGVGSYKTGGSKEVYDGEDPDQKCSPQHDCLVMAWRTDFPLGYGLRFSRGGGPLKLDGPGGPDPWDDINIRGVNATALYRGKVHGLGYYTPSDGTTQAGTFAADISINASFSTSDRRAGFERGRITIPWQDIVSEVTIDGFTGPGANPNWVVVQDEGDTGNGDGSIEMLAESPGRGDTASHVEIQSWYAAADDAGVILEDIEGSTHDADPPDGVIGDVKLYFSDGTAIGVFDAKGPQ